jgi:asparaginyl-tRNA synthetase
MRIHTDHDRLNVLRVKSEITRSASHFLRENDFIEILPVILSPVTDPLRHETFGALIDYYGRPYKLTKSMILHKQAALRIAPRIFCFSPNVRLEPPARADCGRYLAEFVQLDLEIREATRDEIIGVGEGLLSSVVQHVKRHCRKELHELERDLKTPRPPFPRIPYQDVERRFGTSYDELLSRSLEQPTWIIDFPKHVREFYDREDPTRPGTLLDMDLVYPEGYAEALSGGERESTLERVLTRLSETGDDPKEFATYIEIVRAGIPPSAGFGIGIERLTRYVCGLARIEEARLYAKIPGVHNSL